MDGKNWKKCGRNWKKKGSGGGWRCGVLVVSVVIATNALRLMCAYIAIFWQCEVNFTFRDPPCFSGFFHRIISYYHITKILCKP